MSKKFHVSTLTSTTGTYTATQLCSASHVLQCTEPANRPLSGYSSMYRHQTFINQKSAKTRSVNWIHCQILLVKYLPKNIRPLSTHFNILFYGYDVLHFCQLKVSPGVYENINQLVHVYLSGQITYEYHNNIVISHATTFVTPTEDLSVEDIDNRSVVTMVEQVGNHSTVMDDLQSTTTHSKLQWSRNNQTGSLHYITLYYSDKCLRKLQALYIVSHSL